MANTDGQSVADRQSSDDQNDEEEANVMAAVRVGHFLALCSAITVSLWQF